MSSRIRSGRNSAGRRRARPGRRGPSAPRARPAAGASPGSRPRPRCRPPPAPAARGPAAGAGLARRRPRPPGARSGAAGGRRTRSPGPVPSLWAVDRPAVQLDQPPAPASARSPARPGTGRATGPPGRTGRRSRDRSAGAIPIPVSRTRTTASPPSRPTVTVIRPARSVYLAALISRFDSTWVSRTTSPLTRTGSAGRRHGQLVPGRRRSAGWAVSTARPTTAARSTGSLPEFDLAPHDPGHVHQVVHQPDEVRHLPVHHRPGPPDGCPGRPASSGSAGRCGPGPAGCGARGRAWPGTRPSAGPPPSPRGTAGRSRWRPPPGGPGPRPPPGRPASYRRPDSAATNVSTPSAFPRTASGTHMYDRSPSSRRTPQVLRRP